MDKLLTTSEAAAILGLSPRTLEKWREENRNLSYVKLGYKTVRYKESEIKKWLRSQHD